MTATIATAAAAAAETFKRTHAPAVEYPYHLTDEDFNRLSQLQGTLTTLNLLMGELDAHTCLKDNPPLNNEQLHRTFWLLADIAEELVDNIHMEILLYRD